MIDIVLLRGQAAANAAPDGYTILFTLAGPVAVNPGVYQKLHYDPVKDYVLLAGVINVPLVLGDQRRAARAERQGTRRDGQGQAGRCQLCSTAC